MSVPVSSVEDEPVLVAFRLRDPLRHTPAITAQDVRAAIHAEVERLIDLLDAIDGESDEEPWLADNGFGISDDREDDTADDEDGGDMEPSMGWGLPGRENMPGWDYDMIGDHED